MVIAHNKTLLVLATMVVIIMARPSVEHTVHVANKLRDKTLIVHCRSKDDDLEAHAVGLGESFQWSFEPNALGGTLFWCDLAVQDKRLTFAAFEQIGLDQSGPYTGHWYVRGDGVYGKDKSADDVFFKAAWRRVWPRR